MHAFHGNPDIRSHNHCATCRIYSPLKCAGAQTLLGLARPSWSCAPAQDAAGRATVGRAASARHGAPTEQRARGGRRPRLECALEVLRNMGRDVGGNGGAPKICHAALLPMHTDEHVHTWSIPCSWKACWPNIKACQWCMQLSCHDARLAVCMESACSAAARAFDSIAVCCRPMRRLMSMAIQIRMCACRMAAYMVLQAV